MRSKDQPERNWRKKWKEGLRRSRTLRLVRRLALLSAGALTAAVVLRLSGKKDA